MQFETRQDIAVPVEKVFEMLCDFGTFERAAMRRGAQVQRLDAGKPPGKGNRWDASFSFRGKRRTLTLETVAFDEPNELTLHIKSSGLEGQTRFDLIPLSKTQTRLNVSLEITPLVLSTRLLVQSLRLAKAPLTQRFENRVADFARGMEDRYAGPALGRA